MKAIKLLQLPLLMVPFDVFAHAGHVEWSTGVGGAEFIEVAVVLCAITFYLVSRFHKAARMKTSRIKNQNSKTE